MQKLLMAGFGLCLLSLPISVAAQGRAIEGHQNLKLGMTEAEATAAEPLAHPVTDCPSGRCLGYFDRRFLATGYEVRADFGGADSLRRISLSMQVPLGEAPCRRQLQSERRELIRAYGKPASSDGPVTTWEDALGAIALTDGCAAAGGSTIDITIASQLH